jgi:hypothetical protein
VLDPIRRGQLAAEALGNAALQAGLTQMRADITNAWADCPARDQEGREHMWRLMKSMQKFESLLKSYVEAGKADAAMLERKKSPLEVVRGAVGL